MTVSKPWLFPPSSPDVPTTCHTTGVLNEKTPALAGASRQALHRTRTGDPFLTMEVGTGPRTSDLADLRGVLEGPSGSTGPRRRRVVPAWFPRLAQVAHQKNARGTA